MPSFASTRAQSRPYGFTLVEVMVAMVIAGMAVTVVFSGLGVAFDTWAATAAALDRLDDRRYRWHTLRSQLQGALPLRHVVEDGLTRTPVLGFEGDRDRIVFVSRTTFGAGPFAPARWVEWRTLDSGGLDIRESDILPPDNDIADAEAWNGILENVRVRFEFLRPGRGNQPAEWIEEWQPMDEQALPSAVRLVGSAGDAPVRTLIRLDYAEAGRNGLIFE